MAAFTHTLQLTWAGGGATGSDTSTLTGDAEYNITATVVDTSADLEIACVIDVSEIQCIYVNSDYAMLLEINDNVGGGGSINLLADVPYIWWAGSYLVNLLAVDVTALFLTNASGSDATFTLRCVVDPTP